MIDGPSVNEGWEQRSSPLLVNRESNPFPRLFPSHSLSPECALGLMRPDSPVHSELTARPSTEPNRCRIRTTAAPTSIPNASIARNNAKARPERACDLCRRRKTKCDAPSAPDNVCSNCVQNNQSCTYMCVYIHLFSSFYPSHLLLAKPLAREVHQKRPFLLLTINYLPHTAHLYQLCLRP